MGPGEHTLRASHVLCVVDDLAEAVNRFEAAGFTVEWGDRPGRARNALIWFTEGPFIELLARGAGPPRVIASLLSVVAPNGMIRRFDQWNQQPAGWCEIALECDGDIVPVVAGIDPALGKIAGPYSTKRTPPGGREITTQTSFPHDPDLPILMGAYRPNPRPSLISHINGAVGIESIVVEVPPSALYGWSQVLDADDPWITLSSGGVASRVRNVTLEGLTVDLDPNLVCGATITAESYPSNP